MWLYKTGDLLKEVQLSYNCLWHVQKKVTFKYRWLLNRGDRIHRFDCVWQQKWSVCSCHIPVLLFSLMTYHMMIFNTSNKMADTSITGNHSPSGTPEVTFVFVVDYCFLSLSTIVCSFVLFRLAVILSFYLRLLITFWLPLITFWLPLTTYLFGVFELLSEF